MSARILILDIESKGLAASVVVNGITVVQDASRDRLSRSVRLTAWAVPGTNTLQLAAERPGGWGDVAPMLAMKLRDAVPGPDAGADRVLVDYRWDPAVQPLAPAGAVQLLNQPFPFAPPAAWSWTRADAVAQLSDSDRAAIRALLEELHRALAARDIPRLLQLQAVQLGEQAVAAGEQPRAFDAGYAGFLQARMGLPDWTVQPIDWPQLRLTPMAGGRVYHVARAGGAPAIMATCSEGAFGLDPYLSRQQGRWAVVR